MIERAHEGQLTTACRADNQTSDPRVKNNLPMSDFEPYPIERRPSEPPRPAAPGHLVGQAKSVQIRQEILGEDLSQTVLSIRVDTGPQARPVDVELRGTTVSGSVREGDWIEFPIARVESGRYSVRQIANLSTSAQVEADAAVRTPQARIVRLIFLLVLLAALAFIGYVAFQMFQDPLF